MENWKKRSVDLVAGLALLGKVDPSVVPYTPGKTKISSYEARYFTRSTPERHGISSRRLYNMLCELELDRRANPHSILVIKGGEVICECSHPGYSVNTWHLSHSMTKTVTGMAIGMLVDDGSITVEDKVVDFFPELDHRDRRFAEMTVEHLLVMSSGVPFAELGSVTESEWAKAFFDSSLKYTPGADFSYNSMNSYILAEIVTRVTGMPLSEFLEGRLFRPLGIHNRFMERGPSGVEKGGWGLYASAESWAKLGYMMLNLGSFEGTRILSPEWVMASCTRHISTPESLGDFDYGYQMWVGRDDDEFLFNGMLGQNVWVYPKGDIIVAVNSGNNELFQKSATMSIIRKYLHCEIDDTVHKFDHLTLRSKERHFFENRHRIRFAKPRSDLFSLLGLRQRKPYIDDWNGILGTYLFRRNNVGQLPAFVRVMQNNYNCSIDSVRFEREGDGVVMTVTESGRAYRIGIGLYGFVDGVFDFNGEKYMVRAAGEVMENENRERVFKIELLFPELPNTRFINVYPTPDGHAVFKFSEIPNQRIVGDFLDGFIARNPKASLLFKALDNILKEKDYLNNRLADVFSPTLVGYDVSRDGYESLLAEDNEEYDRRIRENLSKVSFLSRFTSTVTDVEPEDGEEETQQNRRSSVLEKLAFFRRGRASASVTAEELEATVSEYDEPEEDGESRSLQLTDIITPTDTQP